MPVLTETFDTLDSALWATILSDAGGDSVSVGSGTLQVDNVDDSEAGIISQGTYDLSATATAMAAVDAVAWDYWAMLFVGEEKPTSGSGPYPFDDVDDFFHAGQTNTTLGGWYWQQKVGGTYDTIGSSATGGGTTYELQFPDSGDEVRFLVDGGEVASLASFPLASRDLYVGCWGYGFGSALDHDFDNLTIDYTEAGGAIAGTAALGFTPGGTVKGTGALSSAAALTLAPAGVLSASGALEGAAGIAITPAGVLTGAGTLAASSDLAFSLTGTLETPSGAIAGTLALALAPVGTLTGAGAAEGAAALSISPSGTLGGAGSLEGAATVTFAAGATLTSSSAIAGSIALDLSPSGTLTGAGALLAGVTCSLDLVAALAGQGRLGGLSTISFTPTGALTAAGIGTPDQRTISVPDQGRTLAVADRGRTIAVSE